MPDNNQVIGATIQVESASVTEASKSIGELKNNVKDLKAALDASKNGTAEQVQAFKNLKAAEEDLAKAQDNLNKTVGEGEGHFSNIREGIGSMGGALGVASEGVGKLDSMFKVLLANPLILVLTAIVAILTTLYKAFTNTFAGAEKVEQVFAGIKAAAVALFDNIGKIAGAIVKFFSFDFSGAIADIKGVVKAAGDAYSAMSNLTKQAQELHRQQLSADLDAANREKKLAELRSQTQDETVPVAKRKAALKELLAATEDESKKEIDLSKKITDNKIAQLTLQKDGELKNQDDITKLRVDQVNKETEAANQVRQIRRALTQAQKQELAEQREAANKAAEEAKKRRQELVDFTNKLNKIQQDNDLATIRDTYAKEQKEIENKISDQKRDNDVALADKKITATQFALLNAALDKEQQLQLDALRDKHNKEVAEKEAAFQKELAAIRGKIAVDGIVNQRDKERQQLLVTYQNELADATKTYKDNADHLHQIQTALAEQYHAEQKQLEQKFQKEDQQNRLKAEETRLKGISDNVKNAESMRLKAVDDEQALIKKAFDDKLITEAEFNQKTDELAKARIAIRQAEQQANEKVADAIGKTFGNLSTLVGKQTALGKAFAIVQATIDTYSSAVKSYNAMAGIPVVGPALGFVAAAAAVAAGIANVKKILAVQVPATSGGSGGVSTGAAPTAAAAPTASSTPVAPVQSSTTFTPQQSPSSSTATSNRAYVVEADVRSAIDRNARLERASRLGGGN